MIARAGGPSVSPIRAGLRIVAAVLFIEAGSVLLFNIPPTVHPAPPPEMETLLVIAGILDLVGGLLILVGFLTRPVAFPDPVLVEEAVPGQRFHQLLRSLENSLPDGAVAELSEQHPWRSLAIALLHELAVPQVLGATERQRKLLRPKVPNAVFIPAPLDPADAMLSLAVLLRSNWPRLLQPNGSSRRRRLGARPTAVFSSTRERAMSAQ